MPTPSGAEFNPVPAIMGFLGVIVVGGFVGYLYFSITLMVIARKSNTPNAWLAWIPIGNVFLMCAIGRRPSWWVLLMLIPFVNVFVGVMVWMSIAEARGKPAWAGALVFLPLVGLFVPIYLAMGEATEPDLMAAPAPVGPPVCAKCGTPAESGEQFCGVCGGPVQAASAAPRICSACNTPAEGDETFCGNCGQPMSVAVATTVGARPRSSAGKLAAVALVMVAFIGLLTAGAGWVAFGRPLSYTPPKRQPPKLPKRMAGTMTEFPVDTKTDAPARPTSIVTQNFQRGSGRSSQTAQVPAKWLPPGVSRDSLPRRANSMTSAVYRTGQKTASATQDEPAGTPAPTSQPPTTTTTATATDQTYVHVLDTPPNQPQIANEIAREVGQATGAALRGVRVQSPDGDVYVGSRIQTPQTSVYVLDKQNSDVVIIIYSPDASTKDVADRLAQNVGNGEGLNDYPETQGSLWTLPPNLPGQLTLEEVNTITADDLISEEDLRTIEKEGGAEAQRLIAQLRQFIPERMTAARYQDGAQRDWGALVWEYGSPRRAWNNWMLIRWIAGTSMKSVSVLGVDGRYTDVDKDRVMIFQKGPYLVILTQPADVPVERLVEMANGFQM